MTIPARDGRTWNDRVLQLLDAIATASGGSAVARDGRTWSNAALRALDNLVPLVGGGAPAAHLYKYADRATTADPQGLSTVDPSATGARLEQVTFTLDETQKATLPSASGIRGQYVEWEIKDLLGDTVNIDQGDVARFTLWLNGVNALPANTYVGLAITAGGVASVGNAGHFFAMRHHADGLQISHQRNLSGGWDAGSLASVVDPLARGFQGMFVPGDTNTRAHRQAWPIVASGSRSEVEDSAPAASSSEASFNDGDLTRIAIVCGWLAASGGSPPQSITVSLRSVVAAWSAIANGGRVLS